MNMLTQDDLKAIGQIIRDEVPPLVKPLIDEKVDSLEERMNIKFEAVHEDLEGIRSQMVTKSYLDEKLAYYAKKPF